MMKKFLAAAVLTAATLSLGPTAVAASGGSADVAPKAGGVAGSSAAAAHEPTVSPAPEKAFHKKGGLLNYNCKKGRLCVDAWDPVHKTYKIFQFYQCKTYSLSYFGGYTGMYVNDQTGGKDGVAKFLTKSGKTKVTSKPVNKRKSIDWDPIWYIKSCPS